MTGLSRNARVAGLLYIASSVFGLVRLIYIPNTLFVPGNAAATANNIASHELVFRLGIVSYLLCSVLWIFVALALYRLFKEVDQTLAILMVLVTLMITPIFFVNAATDVAAVLFARGADLVSAFGPSQREAMAMLFLNVHHQLDLAWQMLGAMWFLPFGLLVYRSRFLPRVLGGWLIIVCFTYLALSFTGFLLPMYERNIARFAEPVLMGEVAIMLWLAIMGAREKPPLPRRIV